MPKNTTQSPRPEIYTKMSRNLSENLVAKFPATALSYSMVKKLPTSMMLPQTFLNWRQVQLKVNHCRKKIRKGKKGKAKKPKQKYFDFCACPSRNVVKHCASGKQRMLSCCKCLRANFVHIQAENRPPLISGQ